MKTKTKDLLLSTIAAIAIVTIEVACLAAWFHYDFIERFGGVVVL